MKQKFILLLLIIPSVLYSQSKRSFEGTLNYDIQYVNKSKTPVNPFCGDEAVVFIKQGYYKQVYPSANDINAVIYRPDKNKYYTLFNNTDSINVLDCSIQDDKLISVKKQNSTIEILNYKCKSVIFKFKKCIVTYYYAEDLYVDPSLFAKHKYFSYDRYVKETNSIYLKMIISYPTYDFIMTAKKINEVNIDDKTFEIVKQ